MLRDFRSSISDICYLPTSTVSTVHLRPFRVTRPCGAILHANEDEGRVSRRRRRALWKAQPTSSNWLLHSWGSSWFPRCHSQHIIPPPNSIPSRFSSISETTRPKPLIRKQSASLKRSSSSPTFLSAASSPSNNCKHFQHVESLGMLPMPSHESCRHNAFMHLMSPQEMPQLQDLSATAFSSSLPVLLCRARPRDRVSGLPPTSSP
jgi:hypothetical protein